MTFPPWAAAHMNLLLGIFFGVAAEVLVIWWAYTEGQCSCRRARLDYLLRMQNRDPKTGRSRDPKTGWFLKEKP